MRRLTLLLALIIILTAACNRPVPDATPTPIVITATPDVTLPPDEPTLDPTPTREVGQYLDCQTLDYHEDFPPVNANPCLLGTFTIVEEVPTSDGRYQAVPNGLYVVIEFVNRSGYTSRRVPPYINERSDPSRYNDYQRGYRAEVHQVDGRVGYGIPGVFLQGTPEQPQRYIIKLGASVNLTGLPNLSDAEVGGRLIFDTGDTVDLPPQQLFDDTGQWEWIWLVDNSENLVTVDVQLWIDMRFASCDTEQGACFFTFQQLSVLRADEAFGGPDDAIDVP